MKLVFTHQAISQAEHIDAWWRENRPAAPHAFAEDFAAVIAVILSMPLTKAPCTVRGGEVFRRRLLGRTKHHVYYTVDQAAGVVHITAVWGGPRGSEPPLTFTG